MLADPETKAAYDALEPIYQIIRLRIERGLTQAQLAERAGVTRSIIARLERGQSQPRLDFLRKVAAALGAKLEIHLVPADQA